MEYLARRGDTGETAGPGCGMSNGAEVGQASRRRPACRVGRSTRGGKLRFKGETPSA
jgi:hypothetical protein